MMLLNKTLERPSQRHPKTGWMLMPFSQSKFCLLLPQALSICFSYSCLFLQLALSQTPKIPEAWVGVRELRDKTISSRTHGGWAPAVPPSQKFRESLLEFQAKGDSAPQKTSWEDILWCYGVFISMATEGNSIARWGDIKRQSLHLLCWNFCDLSRDKTCFCLFHSFRFAPKSNGSRCQFRK